MEQPKPERFGPYITLEQIGSGGMGAVYRARDERLHRDVAVKVLHRHVSASGTRERFLREARAVSSLNHPNICTVFDIGEQDGDPYLVMELLEGVSIRDRLEEGVVVSQPELESIALQCALALAAAHEKGIVHRDIKPANLFLVKSTAGEVQLKVLDFGLAKVESDRKLYGDSGLTRTGATLGTIEYMSPEQARGEPLDPRSDLFSLGAVLYELATGEAPFRGDTSAIIFASLLGSVPAPPRSSNTELSPGMDDIIRKLLEKRMSVRVQTANELAVALRRLHHPIVPTAVATPYATPSGVSKKPVVVPGPSAQSSPTSNEVLFDPTARALRPSAPLGIRLTSTHVGFEIVEDVPGTVDRSPHWRDGQRGSVAKWLIAVVLVLLLIGTLYFFARRSRPAVAANAMERSLRVHDRRSVAGARNVRLQM